MIIFFTDPSFSILLFLFCRPTDRVFTTVSPVEQLIKLVSPYIKYLGIFLDENLNWKKHVSVLSSKLRRANGALAKLHHFVPQDLDIHLMQYLIHI